MYNVPVLVLLGVQLAKMTNKSTKMWFFIMRYFFTFSSSRALSYKLLGAFLGVPTPLT
jgi:hypothetical protein